jgi:hypothetical protein
VVVAVAVAVAVVETASGLLNCSEEILKEDTVFKQYGHAEYDLFVKKE